jgi:hypothetical protein
VWGEGPDRGVPLLSIRAAFRLDDCRTVAGAASRPRRGSRPSETTPPSRRIGAGAGRSSARPGRTGLACILAATAKRKIGHDFFLSSSRKVAGCKFPWWHLRHASPTKGPCYRDPSRTFPFGWGFRLYAVELWCRLVWPGPAGAPTAPTPHRGWPILAAMVHFFELANGPLVVHLQQIGTKDRHADSLIFAAQHGFVTNHIAFVAIPGR